MERPTATVLRIGDWRVDPTSSEISRDGQIARVDVRTMRLLMCLADRAGEVVSSDDLLNQAWAGVIVSQDSVYQSVASLRRLLGDDPKQPTYIATVPRLGYRLVAPVSPWVEPSGPTAAPDAIDGGHPVAPADNAQTLSSRSRSSLAWTVAAVLVLAIVGSLAFRRTAPSRHSAPTAEPLIAVLPFLDLTDGMTQEEFADGMTAELIDKISKIPHLRVHTPLSASSVAGQRTAIADMAKMLDVGYVLDGSVRRSGDRLRVAVRLIRAPDEYVVWSESYDRPVGDVLAVQDDIAGEITKTLTASIETRPNDG